MANIDYLTNYCFTSPKIKNDNDFLYFCDLCGKLFLIDCKHLQIFNIISIQGGPGGFGEYIFFKKSWEAKGFGLTLKAENDFNLEKLSSISLSSFHPFYGELNDGDIYKPKNLVGFRNYVLTETEKRGCEVVVADGGFSCQGLQRDNDTFNRILI